MKWVSCSTKQQCDRALLRVHLTRPPRVVRRSRGLLRRRAGGRDAARGPRAAGGAVRPARRWALLDLRLLFGPSWGARAAFAFSLVNLFCMGLFVWARRALNSPKRWFPIRAVDMSCRSSTYRTRRWVQKAKAGDPIFKTGNQREERKGTLEMVRLRAAPARRVTMARLGLTARAINVQVFDYLGSVDTAATEQVPRRVASDLQSPTSRMVSHGLAV
jgi:hypothetical protein